MSLVDAADADVTFKSSDDILFKIHRIHLEATSGGFPPAGFETLGEVVVLPEAASTLELLFQFAYPVPLPDIHCAEFSFSDIALLGEAAEKYEVFSAMCVCRMYMKYVIAIVPLARHIENCIVIIKIYLAEKTARSGNISLRSEACI